MHLTERQLDRFFHLLDSLLVFANKRLNLVEGLALPIYGEEAEMKAAYVCEALWGNVEVIDEFVRVNPAGLSARDLHEVASWKDALRATFTYVREENGYALLLNEAGLFAVAGLDSNLPSQFPLCPDMVSTALIPFEGLIITDGLSMSDGIPLNEEELRELGELLEQQQQRGVVSSVDEFRVRAQAYNREQHDREFEDFLASVELQARQERFGEQVPAGFHRGVLAGLSPDEREAAIREHLRQLPDSQANELRASFVLEGKIIAARGEGDAPAAPAPGADAAAVSEDEAYERERQEAAAFCAETLVQCCGLLTLREAYESYKAVVVSPLQLDEFVALLMNEDSYQDRDFVLQDWEGDSYLMHFCIADDSALELVISKNSGEVAKLAGPNGPQALDAAATQRLEALLQESLEAEMEALDGYRHRVREMQGHMPRRPLEPSAIDGSFIDGLFARRAVRQLRDFYDAHVPDGEDDYTFADRAVEDVVFHSIETGDVTAYVGDAERAGLNKCAEDEGLLLRLLENAYAALPSWEFNGWSPQEATEKLTGRAVFYNARGQVSQPAPGDPCPCGSGVPFRSCHGA